VPARGHSVSISVVVAVCAVPVRVPLAFLVLAVDAVDAAPVVLVEDVRTVGFAFAVAAAAVAFEIAFVVVAVATDRGPAAVVELAAFVWRSASCCRLSCSPSTCVFDTHSVPQHHSAAPCPLPAAVRVTEPH